MLSPAASRAMLPRKYARHAKPSRTTPVLLAGGLTAAIAVTDGAALASSASAGGSAAQFDRLAACESGGNWSINTGNGYYGGLQFNLGTWRGLGFGGYPHQASKATQVAAGQKLQGQRGWGPWPSCSRQLGLSGNGGDDSDGGTAGAETLTASSSADRRESAARASRSRAATSAARAAAVAERETRLVAIRALGVTDAPRFDGHVLSVADVGTQRIAVKHWQRRVAARGWSITVDGQFGPQSAAVANKFAADKKVTTGSGTVDKQLWDLAWTSPVTL